MTPVRQSLYFSYNRLHALRATPLSRIISSNVNTVFLICPPIWKLYHIWNI
nr:MAG TPA: hypothetical protein [Caudoviricetes sp.]